MSGADVAYDLRTTAARPDLAAARLRDTVPAPRYSEGEAYTVLTETVDVKRSPRPDAPLETQFLYGETLIVYDDDNGWGWAQGDSDGYVGYVAMSALGRRAIEPTHRVVASRTFVYPAADMKQPPYATIPMNGRVLAEGTSGAFLKIRGHGFIVGTHAAKMDRLHEDPARIAETLAGVPYLWGGRSPLGIDCSGLVQLAFAMAGIELPRDTDMQERIGSAVPLDALCRGDLVFWPGHVGVMADGTQLIHASGHHMLVTKELLADVVARNSAINLQISSARRLKT